MKVSFFQGVLIRGILSLTASAGQRLGKESCVMKYSHKLSLSYQSAGESHHSNGIVSRLGDIQEIVQ